LEGEATKMAEKNLVYRGKSRDVFKIAGGSYKGKYRFVFTDRATGNIKKGKPVFDPGYDVVVAEIPGKGAIACRFATHLTRGQKNHSKQKPGFCV
jgi:phosphoribosylaminoimidazole-succinocarboxamide synthase